ncbi:MAG: DinB family protein [Ferruginibacter sp.]
MKQMLAQYAAYNAWANKLLTDIIVDMPDEQVKREIVSSFPSLYKTLLHLWDVESIWWQRMKLQDVVTWPSESFKGTLLELIQAFHSQSRQWKEWIDLSTEAALQHEFIYKNSKRDQFKQPVYETIMHLFNHQTHHRGQLITMLRQSGIKQIPITDLIAFLRKK